MDTHAVIWAALEPNRISAPTRSLLSDAGNRLCYSVTALWEIAIKNGTRRPLNIDPFAFRSLLKEADFDELPITADHTLTVSRLPRLHADPFDRILLAQALVEKMTIVTSDRVMMRYADVSFLGL